MSTFGVIPPMCDGCSCLRAMLIKGDNEVPSYVFNCVIFFDIPKKYIDENKCPHYTEHDDHTFYKKVVDNDSKIYESY